MSPKSIFLFLFFFFLPRGNPRRSSSRIQIRPKRRGPTLSLSSLERASTERNSNPANGSFFFGDRPIIPHPVGIQIHPSFERPTTRRISTFLRARLSPIHRYRRFVQRGLLKMRLEKCLLTLIELDPGADRR